MVFLKDQCSIGAGIQSFEDYEKEIREKRRKEREVPVRKALTGHGVTDVIKSGVVKLKTDDSIDTCLRELKKNEPTSDNEFFRLSIIGYEFHDLFSEIHRNMANVFRALVYSNRFKDSKKFLFKGGFKNKDQVMGEGKLAMADLLIQLNVLCITNDWNFKELRKLGLEHLKERHKDFKRDEWVEVK